MKKLLALLLVVVLCLSLAACATTPKDTATDTTPADTAADTAKDDAADNTADDSNASEPAAEGGKNIVWAGWSGEEEASKDIFQRMMKTYEDASGNTVTWVGWTWADTAQQLLIRTQGGEQLDLAQADIGIFNTIAAAGVLADWNEILGEDYLKENFEQSALDVGNIDGKQLGLPWSMASITMVYNPEILAAAGWDTVPTTIEEFEQCMADIKAYDANIIPYAVSTKDATCAGDFMPWLWTFGGAIFNEDGTVAIDSDAAVKCVEWYQKLMNEGYIAMDTGRGEARQMFAQGQVAFYDDAVVAKGQAVNNGVAPEDVVKVCSAMSRPSTRSPPISTLQREPPTLSSSSPTGARKARPSRIRCRPHGRSFWPTTGPISSSAGIRISSSRSPQSPQRTGAPCRSSGPSETFSRIRIRRAICSAAWRT